MAEFGKLRPPFPVAACASSTCPHGSLTEEGGAYLFMDLETNKLTVFCGDCTAYVELNRPERFKLIML